MQSTITTMAVIACCGLLFLNHSKSERIKDLEYELSGLRIEASRLNKAITAANDALRELDAFRQTYYDNLRRAIVNEPDERDGVVAPALADTIGRLR